MRFNFHPKAFLKALFVTALLLSLIAAFAWVMGFLGLLVAFFKWSPLCFVMVLIVFLGSDTHRGPPVLDSLLSLFRKSVSFDSERDKVRERPSYDLRPPGNRKP